MWAIEDNALLMVSSESMEWIVIFTSQADDGVFGNVVNQNVSAGFRINASLS